MTKPKIKIEIKNVPSCRFDHGSGAAGHYLTPNGCACFPEDKEQDLCGQHIINAMPIGEMTLTVIYDPVFFEVMDYLSPEQLQAIGRGEKEI